MHPLVEEARRLAPGAPKGQKRIAAIKSPLVYRIRHGRWRGATWLDSQRGVFWLLAAETREEGSRDDAYAHFEGLHDRGLLLPGDEDQLREDAEEVGRLLARIEADISACLAAAREHHGSTDRHRLANFADVMLLVEQRQGLEELWVAVPKLDVRGEGIRAEIRNLIFGMVERETGPAEWDWVSVQDWPNEELPWWYEAARLGLRGR
jgi:hypothetical protein